MRYLLTALCLLMAASPAQALAQTNPFDHLRKTAEQGNPGAQYELGRMHYFGEGVARDHRKAFEWFQKAAAQGDSLAQVALGSMYYNGEGVTLDRDKGCQFMRLAAEQGLEEALDFCNKQCR